MNMLFHCARAAAIWLVLGPVVWGQASTLVETHKFLASDGAAGDSFGRSVSIGTGGVAVGSTGNDGTLVDQGAVYVFSPTTYAQLHKLVAADPHGSDDFGFSVSVSGNRVIVGAPQSDSGSYLSSGSAYVFDLTSGAQQFKFANPEALPASQQFGFSVAADGTASLIGADYGFTATRGKKEGAAYAYDIGSGTYQFKQPPSDPASWDYYGTSVAVSGNRGLVGAPGDDDNVLNSGSVYVVNLDPSTHGTELRKLTASDPATDDLFGIAVALEGNLAIVGAPSDDASSCNNRGSVYGFDISTGTQSFKLTPGEVDEDEKFGESVAIDGNLIAVGAPGDSGNCGAVYVFDATTHEKLYKLTASDAAVGDQFGSSVAINGRTVVAGAPSDDSKGAAYLFTIPETSRIPGDTNHDGHVDQADARTLATYWGQSDASWEMGDFDDDGFIGPSDASILAANWGYPAAESASAPEPGVVALLVGALAGLIRPGRRQ